MKRISYVFLITSIVNVLLLLMVSAAYFVLEFYCSFVADVNFVQISSTLLKTIYFCFGIATLTFLLSCISDKMVHRK